MPTRTSPKKPKPTPVVEPTPFEPIRIKSKTKEPGDNQVVLFYIDDRPFSVPSRVSQGMTLEYLRLARTMGESAAAQRILERLLGPEAYAEVEQSDDIDDEALEQILAAVTSLLVGPPDAEGKGRP
ncbi:hypothetical protein ACWGB8_02020 [Kitasatospora sp. NPDC054939]